MGSLLSLILIYQDKGLQSVLGEKVSNLLILKAFFTLDDITHLLSLNNSARLLPLKLILKNL